MVGKWGFTIHLLERLNRLKCYGLIQVLYVEELSDAWFVHSSFIPEQLTGLTPEQYYFEFISGLPANNLTWFGSTRVVTGQSVYA